MSVAEWFRIIDLELIAPQWCGFESQYRLLDFSCEEAVQLAYRMLMVLLGCLLVPEIGGAPEVFLASKAGKSPYNLYSVVATLRPTKT